MKLERKEITSFSSFQEANEAECLERWSMAPTQRLEILENLRRLQYPNRKSAPRILKVLCATKNPAFKASSCTD